MTKLAGVTFAWNAIKQDYHIIETLNCLYELCDEISIAVGGDDGTMELVYKWVKEHSDRPVHIYQIGELEWREQVGREKLSYFSNKAIESISSPWFIYIQADEILHEDCFETVRKAINEAGDHPEIDAIFCRRLNLWKDPLHMLNVPQYRKPVSNEVVRLARTHLRCYDDAEQIGCSNPVVYGDIDDIQIFHMGFVRDKVKHLEKIRHMQTEVFLWGDFDVKAKDCTEFQPDRWFDPEKDLVPIPRSLPKFIQAWCEERYPEIKKAP